MKLGSTGETASAAVSRGDFGEIMRLLAVAVVKPGFGCARYKHNVECSSPALSRKLISVTDGRQSHNR